MRKLLPIALVVGGYFAWHFYKTNKAIHNLQIKVSGLQLNQTSTGLLNTVLHLTLSVFNPESVNLAFKQFAGVLIYAGQEVAHFNVHSDKAIVIRGNGISQVPLDATIENLNALSMLPSILQNGMSGISIKGIININGIHVPVDLDYNDF